MNRTLPSKEELLKYLRTSEARRALEIQFLVSAKVSTTQLARFEANRTISSCLVIFGNDPNTGESAEGVRTPLFSFERRVDGAECDICRIGAADVRTEIGYALTPLRFFPKGHAMEIVAAEKKLEWFDSGVQEVVSAGKVVAFPSGRMRTNAG